MVKKGLNGTASKVSLSPVKPERKPSQGGQHSNKSRTRMVKRKIVGESHDIPSNLLDDKDMYREIGAAAADKKKKATAADLRHSYSNALVNPAEKRQEEKNKQSKKKRYKEKMKQFAETIGVEDNETYPKFKEAQRLCLNVSMCRYFVVRYVAKHLFNFRLSFKNIDDPGESPTFNPHKPETFAQNQEDMDIYWTDNSVPPEKMPKLKPYQKTNHFAGMF